MLSLPDDVLNRIRSWLSFHELHVSRRVSKQWENTTGVSKSCVWDWDTGDEPIPSSTADFSGAKKLICNVYNIEDEYVQGLMPFIVEIFKQSRTSLKTLSFRPNIAACTGVFRNLKPLTSVIDAELHELDDEMLALLINNISEVRKLDINSVCDDMARLELDFKKLSSLRHLSLNGIEITNVRNGELCKIEYLWFGNYDFEDARLMNAWSDHFLNNLKQVEVYLHQPTQVDVIRRWIQLSKNIRIVSQFRVFVNFCIRGTFCNGTLSFGISKTWGSQEWGRRQTEKVNHYLTLWQRIYPGFCILIDPAMNEVERQDALVLLVSSRFFTVNHVEFLNRTQA